MMTLLTTLLIMWGTISIVYGLHFFVREKKAGYFRSTMLLLGISAGIWQLGYGVFGICDNIVLCEFIRKIALLGVSLYPLAETVLALHMTRISRKVQYLIRIILTVGALLDWALFSRPETDVFVRVNGFTRFKAVTSASRSYHLTFVMIVFLIAFASWCLWYRETRFKREKRLLFRILIANLAIMVCTLPDTILVEHLEYGYPTSGIGAGISLVLWFVAAEKYNTFSVSSRTIGDYVRKVANEGIVIFDVKGRAVDINKFASEVLEIEPKAHPSDFLETDEDDETIFKKLEDGTYSHYKSRMIKGDSVYMADMTAAWDDYDEPFGYIMTLIDITKEEDLIVKAQSANEAKSKFLANMSHEIRTPMNAITGLADIIVRDSVDPVAKENASMIATSSQSLLAIINDILDFSRIESGKMSIVNELYRSASILNDVTAIILMRLQGKNIKLDIHVNPSFPSELIGDAVRIKQVLINLLNNAVKYTNEGYIILNVDYEKLDYYRCRIKASVTDTGIGIKDTDLDKLFESFTQVDTKRNRAEEGTGLGLAISKQLVNMMGGDIEVESIYGHGSSFSFDIVNEVASWVSIGDIEKVLTRTEPEFFDVNITAKDAKILLVDDNSINLRVMEGMLQPYDIKPVSVESGKAAIRCAEHMNFDIIFMDHMMPEMDGVEAMQKIREIKGYGNGAIIALTANAIMGARQSYLKMGFDDFIGKPVSPAELDETLRKYLRPELISNK
ncbi:MAG: response regulator [Lachnospiraceae bacterium]|nr:response regulator [Lachnospiraceae bacterium]